MHIHIPLPPEWEHAFITVLIACLSLLITLAFRSIMQCREHMRGSGGVGMGRGKGRKVGRANSERVNGVYCSLRITLRNDPSSFWWKGVPEPCMRTNNRCGANIHASCHEESCDNPPAHATQCALREMLMNATSELYASGQMPSIALEVRYRPSVAITNGPLYLTSSLSAGREAGGCAGIQKTPSSN